MKGLENRNAEPHFVQRCKERGIRQTDPWLLMTELRAAIRTGNDDFCQLVKAFNDGLYYRFKVSEGVFYVVASGDGHPRTVITQEMFSQTRRKYKGRKHRMKGTTR